MRKISVILLFLSFFLLGYDPEPSYYNESTGYEPIIVSREQLEKSVSFSRSKTLVNPGKIYLKDKTLFIVEKFKGIHVIDNSDRANPKKLGFINVPGCVDLAIKGRNMYVDNAVDLIAIDIGDFPNIFETSRIINVFPELVPPDIEYMPYRYSINNRPSGTIIVDWIPKN